MSYTQLSLQILAQLVYVYKPKHLLVLYGNLQKHISTYLSHTHHSALIVKRNCILCKLCK